MNGKSDYLFYVEYADGEVHLTNGLTRLQAVRRYNKVNKSYDPNVKRVGWELVQDTLSQLMLKKRASPVQ